jgi:dynein light intermediate chain 1, cytosolic
VLDTDHEGLSVVVIISLLTDVDILARLSIYTLSKPSTRFLPLLRPLFTPATIPNMLLVVLLDWSEPWNWVRQLRAWIRLLHSLLQSLPSEAVHALQENIVEWRDRKRNAAKDAPSSTETSSLDPDVSLPLGPGEWDLPLGVPLCVVCQNANKIETLERESGWTDRQFDFVQQYLRTVLLKHGGSLIYTMPHLTGTGGTTFVLKTLVHMSLGIQSLLQQSSGTSQSTKRMMAVLKHNTTDRDSILVPPNFDSWGKIRILTEAFNVEEVSEAWAQDIEAPGEEAEEAANGESKKTPDGSESFAVLLFKEVIKAPEDKANPLALPNATKSTKSGLEVESKDIQGFLGEQAVVLDELGRDDSRSQTLRDTKKNLGPMGAGDVEEHIGPVQFNLGGIQMDAEDVVRRLKVCQSIICCTTNSMTGPRSNSSSRSRSRRHYRSRIGTSTSRE